MNYTTADVDALYCRSSGPVNNTFNGESELDPDADNTSCAPRPVFATCKNTCPGGEEI